MEKQLREQAEKKVEAKMAFYQCLVIFSGVSVILIILSFFLVNAALWLLIPIPVFVMVLAVLFLSAFGIPTANGISENWEEEEIEKEIRKLRQRKKVSLPPLEDLTEADKLELKELERLQDKWDVGDEYV